MLKLHVNNAFNLHNDFAGGILIVTLPLQSSLIIHNQANLHKISMCFIIENLVL